MNANASNAAPLASDAVSPSVPLDPLDLLKQLIAIPSVSPMGNDVSGPQYFEHGMTEWLVAFFRRLGVPYEVQEVLDGRCNVIARLETDPAAPTIMLDAHQDTVPVEGMTIEPFTPVVNEGRIYGRGACDVKGGMASMLAAFARLVQERPTGAANVIMACTCDEEYTALGARHLARQWQSDDSASSWTAMAPDVCVVAEPTDLNVIVAHRGVVRWKIRTLGKACHSSRPHEGHSAIYDMARVVTALEEYAEQLPQRGTPHPLCGTSTLSVGKINGGTSVNIVPHLCEIEIDRRTLPGESSADALSELETYLREKTSANFEMLPPWIDADSLADDHNPELADRLLEQIAAVAGPREKQGAWYGTNASCFAVTGGVPAVVFGPGSIAQAHTEDEWLEIEQLHQAREIYYQFCRQPDLQRTAGTEMPRRESV